MPELTHEAPNAATVRCSACALEQDAPAATGRHNCRGCGAMLPGNAARLTHGLRRYQRTGRLPADLQVDIDAFRESVVLRQGGRIAEDGSVSDIDPLTAGRIRLLVDAEALRLLHKHEAIRAGVGTKAGAKAADRVLATVDRWLRIANELPAPEEAPLTLDAMFAAFEEQPEVHAAPRGDASGADGGDEVEGAGIAPEIARGTVEP